MRRINFIAPVESMQGNLSGDNNLLYQKNDNKAFYAPDGRQYAKNYGTRYIGALRARDKRAYFAVKQRSATLVTDIARKRWAVLGATAAIRSALIADEPQAFAQIQANLTAKVVQVVAAGGSTTLYKEFFKVVSEALANKTAMTFSGSTVVNVCNPFNLLSQGDSSWVNLTINQDVWVKFMPYLGYAGNIASAILPFTIDGHKMFAPRQPEGPLMSWSGLIIDYVNDTTNENFAAQMDGLTLSEGSPEYVKYGANYVLLDNVYQTGSVDITKSAYKSTAVAPEP